MTEPTYDVRVERVVHALPEQVFDAYTDPVAGQTLFSGGEGWVVEVACDLRVGGLWTIVSGPPDSEPYRETNRFTEIDRPKRLAFDSTLEIPGGLGIERAVEVTLKPTGGGAAAMTIAQGGFPSIELRDAFIAGLADVFDGLNRTAPRWPAR